MDNLASHDTVHESFDIIPSVPSESVASFSSSTCICPANAPLKSLNCFRFASSAFFSLIRARSIGDCPEGFEARLAEASELWRRWEGRGLEGFDIGKGIIASDIENKELANAASSPAFGLGENSKFLW
jgi:hypothetical protein